MGISKKTSSAQKGRRVSLVRQGENPSPNVRKAVPKTKSTVKFALPEIRGGFSVLLVGVCSFILCFVLGFVFIYAYRYVTTAEYFALKNISIQGQERLETDEVLLAASLDKGHNLLDLSLEAVERRITTLPWVEEVTVQRVLPDSLVVSIKERQPIFWTLVQGIVSYTDIAGELIAPVRPDKFVSLPMLEIEQGAEQAKAELPGILHRISEVAWPESLQSIAKVKLSASQNVEIFFRGKPLHVFVGMEELDANFERLVQVLADLQGRGEIDEIGKIKAQGANVWVHKTNSERTGG